MGDEVLTQDAIDRAMLRGWYPVARVEDLDRPRATELLGQRLVAFRTAAGRRPSLVGVARIVEPISLTGGSRAAI